MNLLWPVITALASLAVAVAMFKFANGMSPSAPHRVRLPVSILAGAAVAYAFSPLWIEGFTWTDALFAVAVALYVWLDRRKPA